MQREAAKFRKKGRAADRSSIAADGKARRRALNAAQPLRPPKKFPAPPMPEVSAQLRCKKLKKAMGTLLFCAWFGTAVGCREYFLNAEVPFRRTLQNKRAEPGSSNGRATRALRIPQGQK